ncbi:MAG: hypothetical protein H8D56_26400 [Planctomycetes bacterium]|nr:hypothetical protein [Planctomycetota bacterium]
MRRQESTGPAGRGSGSDLTNSERPTRAIGTCRSRCGLRRSNWPRHLASTGRPTSCGGITAAFRSGWRQMGRGYKIIELMQHPVFNDVTLKHSQITPKTPRGISCFRTQHKKI